MLINGKERGFFYSVFASKKLAALCKGKSINNLQDLFSDDATGGEYLPKVAVILQEADELRKVWEAKARGESYTADIMSEDEFYSLPMWEVQEIELACFEAIQKGSEKEIQTKPVPVKKTDVEKTGAEELN